MYEYRAEIVRVIDGDTVVADVDLGFNTTVREIFRLHGINAPEKRGPEREEGKKSKEYLENLLYIENDFLIIRTFKDKKGKYGRYLATLISNEDGTNFNEKMVESGHAVYKDY